MQSKKDTFWTTIKGERIEISNLENGHLLNIIRFLRRRAHIIRANVLHEYLVVLPKPTAEGAYDAYTSEISTIETMSEEEILKNFTVYDNLIREANKRGLVI